MPARKRNRGPAISLFPFLSVLAVVIGTLTMIITGISLGEITENSLPERESEPVAEASSGRVVELRSSLAVLGEREQEVRRSLEAVRLRVAEKEAELATAQVRGRKDSDKRILPYQGSGRGRSPAFVECSADGLLLNAQGEKERRTLVPSGEIEGSASLEAFLDGVRSREGGLAVFVIRPGGVSAFDRARPAVKRIGTPCGYMAAPGRFELDYGLYAGE